MVMATHGPLWRLVRVGPMIRPTPSGLQMPLPWPSCRGTREVRLGDTPLRHPVFASPLAPPPQHVYKCTHVDTYPYRASAKDPFLPAGIPADAGAPADTARDRRCPGLHQPQFGTGLRRVPGPQG